MGVSQAAVNRRLIVVRNACAVFASKITGAGTGIEGQLGSRSGAPIGAPDQH